MRVRHTLALPQSGVSGQFRGTVSDHKKEGSAFMYALFTRNRQSGSVLEERKPGYFLRYLPAAEQKNDDCFQRMRSRN